MKECYGECENCVHYFTKRGCNHESNISEFTLVTLEEASFIITSGEYTMFQLSALCRKFPELKRNIKKGINRG